jgi:hypothetical protein
VTVLLEEARAGTTSPPADSGALAHALLAAVSAEVLVGVGADRWPAHRAAVLALAGAVTG